MGCIFASDKPAFRFPDVVLFAAVPASLVAAALAAVVSMTISVLALGIGLDAYWGQVLHYVRVGDLAFGVGKASVCSIVLVALARWTAPAIRTHARSRIARGAIAWLAAGLALLPVDLLFRLVLAAK